MTAPTYYSGLGGGVYERIGAAVWRSTCRACGAGFTFAREASVTVEPAPPGRCERCRGARPWRAR